MTTPIETPAPLRLGAKTLAILRMARYPVASAERERAYVMACHQFAAKAIHRKAAELAERGYLGMGDVANISVDALPVLLSWLTDKGRHALECHVMRD